MSAADTVQAMLAVRRYDPDNAPQTTWSRYQIELPTGSTVLEALMYVQEHIDGSLAFRRSCRHGICGSCGMRINGCARLACTTQLADAVAEAERRVARLTQLVDISAESTSAATGDAARSSEPEHDELVVRVEPLGNMPVIKDLVTDMSSFWAKLRSVRPWLQSLDEHPDPDHERLMSPNDYSVIADGLLCVECGACYSDCTALAASPEFVGPTALVKAFRYAYDVRDDQTHRRLYDLSGEHGLWECARCYVCTERCPKHLRVRELIGRLAELAMAEGLCSDAAVRRAQAFVSDIQRTGSLDERTLGIRTRGALQAARDLPRAVRAMAAGKVRPHGVAPIERLNETQDVMERLRPGNATAPREKEQS